LSNPELCFSFYVCSPRTTRSSKAALSISNFFSTPEEEGAEAAAPQRAPEDGAPSPRIKPIRGSNVFEKPGRKPKKAPKLKGSGSSSSRSRSSKQQPSISNFLRNEQIFSEVTAQHCLADNFSPDDIEMALALSKSEAEKRGCLRLNDDDDDAVVDLVGGDSEASKEDVRKKLQKYGFRTAAKEDYKSLAILPVVSGRGSRRGKWANKFTALTLRNADIQRKKLEEKVRQVLAQQVRTKDLEPHEQTAQPYELISDYLDKLRASSESQILHEPGEGALENLGLYYVPNLFEVSHTPAHHLLKNWAAIQGRDLSPERESAKSRQLRKQLDQAYVDLEKHFEKQQELDQQVAVELDELEKLVADNLVQEDSRLLDNMDLDAASTSSSPLKEPPDKRPKMQEKDDKENLQPPKLSSFNVPAQTTRCTSPDLFADSDDEPNSTMPESSGVRDLSLKVYKDDSVSEASSLPAHSVSNESQEVREFSLTLSKKTIAVEHSVVEEVEEATQISTYEVFSSSSDEGESIAFIRRTSLQTRFLFISVKTVSNATQERNTIEDMLDNEHIIDLTQELQTDAEKSLQKAHLSEPDCSVDLSSQEEFCRIQTSNPAGDPNIDDHDLDENWQHTSFLFDIAPSSPNDSKQSSSFSELNYSRNLLRRSVSLSTDNSFKSPLNWKINSSADKRELATQSPYKHSDASIDLTENSDEEVEAILLSDEEINYSIWKANKTAKMQDFEENSSDSSLNSPPPKKRPLPHFQTEEDLDAFLMDLPEDEKKSQSSRSPNKSALSRERAEFGILDAAPSQPFSLSQLQSPVRQESPSQVDINWSQVSFLDAPVKPLARKSSHRFEDLLAKIDQPDTHSDIEFDEFDQLVFQKPKETIDDVPSGLDNLLKGEIKMPPSLPKEPADVPDQLEVDGNVYTVRMCHTPKPDFTSLSESEILQRLYNYGIKPLKRKQAVKMLEFIYNQTHPIMQESVDKDRVDPPIVRSKSTPVMSSKPKLCTDFIKSTQEDCLTPTEPPKDFKFEGEGRGEDLLRFSQSQPPSLCDDFEFYILQTNVTKKTPQPLIPLHIAWHNLLCANPRLHESVLMYEPIDLQEVYLHLKHMGHRYDPKDLKGFLDRRCIIFRYDLTAPGKQAERPVRKKPKKAPRRK
ncbi:hypothetical protein KR018_000143, partial [Drosophila ironensis]